MPVLQIQENMTFRCICRMIGIVTILVHGIINEMSCAVGAPLHMKRRVSEYSVGKLRRMTGQELCDPCILVKLGKTDSMNTE
jgi:hypothetical protein